MTEDTRVEPCPRCGGAGWQEDSRGTHRRCMVCGGDGVHEVRYLDGAAYHQAKRETLASLREMHAAGLWQIDNLPPEGVDELPEDYQFHMRPGPNLEVIIQDIMRRRGVSYDDAILIVGEQLVKMRDE